MGFIIRPIVQAIRQHLANHQHDKADQTRSQPSSAASTITTTATAAFLAATEPRRYHARCCGPVPVVPCMPSYHPCGHGSRKQQRRAYRRARREARWASSRAYYPTYTPEMVTLGYHEPLPQAPHPRGGRRLHRSRSAEEPTPQRRQQPGFEPPEPEEFLARTKSHDDDYLFDEVEDELPKDGRKKKPASAVDGPAELQSSELPPPPAYHRYDPNPRANRRAYELL